MNLALRAPIATATSLRDAMRHLVSGVCVVTAGVDDDRTGTTVTSATSLSVDPPTMIVCLNRSTAVWPIIRRYRHFCINILAEHQQEIAGRFAGRDGVKGVARYAGTHWSVLTTGASALDEALAAIDCELDHDVEWHSHALVIGAVKALRTGSGNALVYSHGRYGIYPRP